MKITDNLDCCQFKRFQKTKIFLVTQVYMSNCLRSTFWRIWVRKGWRSKTIFSLSRRSTLCTRELKASCRAKSQTHAQRPENKTPSTDSLKWNVCFKNQLFNSFADFYSRVIKSRYFWMSIRPHFFRRSKVGVNKTLFFLKLNNAYIFFFFLIVPLTSGSNRK